MSTQILGERDVRTVLGVVSVQVERDHRTGAAVVRSVAPISSSPGADGAKVVFDDGRKSIYTLGASEGQPSTQELGRILNAIDGVGMTGLLDDVTVVTAAEETRSGNVDERGRTEETSSNCHMKEDHMTRDYESHNISPAEGSREQADTEAGDGNTVEDQNFDDGPVTLLFLGYTDATVPAIQGGGDEGTLRVERVMITDEGDEYVIGSEASDKETDGQDETKEILLAGNGTDCDVQGEEAVRGHRPPSENREGGANKRTCRCCAVM